MHLKTVIKYLRRSPYQAVSASLIMALTFFSISLFAIITILSVRLINYFESRPQLTVFFKDSATMQDITSLQKSLESTQKTSSVVFVSKEQALKIYKELNKNDPILLDLVTADVLPASIEVQATRPEYLSDLAKIVNGSPMVEKVVFQQDIVNTLVSWTNALRKIGIVIIAVLLAESLFVILTIIGIKITIRREEIEIMKLIGASNWFIRAPFLLEGMIYGFVGAIIGWIIASTLLIYSTPLLESFLKSVPVLPISYPILLELLGLELVIAGIVGIFASYVAVLRYLK